MLKRRGRGPYTIDLRLTSAPDPTRTARYRIVMFVAEAAGAIFVVGGLVLALWLTRDWGPWFGDFMARLAGVR